MLEGDDISKALGLKYKQKGTPTRNTERDQNVAVSVYVRIKEGMTLEVAAEKVAPLYGFKGEYGFTKVKDHYKEHKAIAPVKLSWYDDLEKIGIPRPYK